MDQLSVTVSAKDSLFFVVHMYACVCAHVCVWNSCAKVQLWQSEDNLAKRQSFPSTLSETGSLASWHTYFQTFPCLYLPGVLSSLPPTPVGSLGIQDGCHCIQNLSSRDLNLSPQCIYQAIFPAQSLF